VREVRVRSNVSIKIMLIKIDSGKGVKKNENKNEK